MTNDTMTLPGTAVRKADATDLPAAADALAAAFQDDPIFRWCVPDDTRREQVLPQFFGLLTEILFPYDECYVDVDGTGAALWVPPGQPAVPESAADAFEDGLAELLGADAERTFDIVAMLDEHHPHDAHHYLWFLGVTPRRQGAGIGAALMRPVLGRADADHAPAYLEATSEHNCRLYERHGFVVVEELAVTGSPSLWAMWREPAT